jgi:predicted nucleotidyltransferase
MEPTLVRTVYTGQGTSSFATGQASAGSVLGCSTIELQGPDGAMDEINGMMDGQVMVTESFEEVVSEKVWQALGGRGIRGGDHNEGRD